MRWETWLFKSPVCWWLLTCYNMKGLVTDSLFTWAAKLNLTEKKSKCQRMFCYKRFSKLSTSTSSSLLTDKVSQAQIGHPTPSVKSWAQCVRFAADRILPLSGSQSLPTSAATDVDIWSFLPTHRVYSPLQDTSNDHPLFGQTVGWSEYILSTMPGEHMDMWASSFQTRCKLEFRPAARLLPLPLAPATPFTDIHILQTWEGHLPLPLFWTEMESSQKPVILFCFIFWP